MIWEEGPQFLLPWWRCYLHFWWYILRKELPSLEMLAEKKLGRELSLFLSAKTSVHLAITITILPRSKNLKTLTFMPFVAVLLKVQILSRHEGHLISLRFKIRFRICSIERFPFPSFFRFHHYPRNYEDKQAGPPDGCQLLLLSRLQTKNAFYPFFVDLFFQGLPRD